ncbi:hypothetical protein EZS27_040919, partial [termite gut metagenome]
SYKLEYYGGEPIQRPLLENGDFRSEECIEILKNVDIVVTNPPFSLFREYVAQLIEYGNKFIIIGSDNAITYKEIFKQIKANNLWLGYNSPKKFYTTKESTSDIKSFGNISWYTNLTVNKSIKDLMLTKSYYGNEQDYPKYDNYDAINVDKLKDIPIDYFGIMGVPITYMKWHNIEEKPLFKLVGSNRGVDQDPNGVYGRGSYLNGKETFKRLFIQRIK